MLYKSESSLEQEILIKEGHVRNHFGAGNVMYFNLGGGHMNVYINTYVHTIYTYVPTQKFIAFFSMIVCMCYICQRKEKKAFWGKKVKI